MISTILFNTSLRYSFFPTVCWLWLIVGISNIDSAAAQGYPILQQNAANIQPVDIAQKNSQYQDIRAARISVEIQLPDLETKIRQSESRIRDFREKHQVVDLTVEAEKSVKTINSLNQEITTASAGLAAEKSRIAKIQALLGAKVTGKSLVNLQRSGLAETLVTEYFKADFQRVALEQQINALVYVSTAYRDRANRLPQLEQAQRELNRQREGLSTTYKTLRTRLDQLRISEVESQSKDPKTIRTFLEKQLADAETLVRASESRIRDFREKHQVVNLAAEALASIDSINRLNQEITDHSGQLAATKYRIGKIQTLLGTKTIGKNLLSLQKSAWQKAVVEDYINADFQRATLEQKINAAVYVSTAYRDRANRFPQLMQAQQELERQLEVNLATYKSLRAKLDQLLTAKIV
jgi:uncharacterized protein involved in exopolysaccharide biosynthesis